jgi:hypothetical protein
LLSVSVSAFITIEATPRQTIETSDTNLIFKKSSPRKNHCQSLAELCFPRLVEPASIPVLVCESGNSLRFAYLTLGYCKSRTNYEKQG